MSKTKFVGIIIFVFVFTFALSGCGLEKEVIKINSTEDLAKFSYEELIERVNKTVTKIVEEPNWTVLSSGEDLKKIGFSDSTVILWNIIYDDKDSGGSNYADITINVSGEEKKQEIREILEQTPCPEHTFNVNISPAGGEMNLCCRIDYKEYPDVGYVMDDMNNSGFHSPELVVTVESTGGSGYNTGRNCPSSRYVKDFFEVFNSIK